jgi:putative aldouronate transport system permease protein
MDRTAIEPNWRERLGTRRVSFAERVSNTLRALNKYKLYYLLAAPGFIWLIVFRYLPMVGVIVAFKDITPFSGLDGILHQPFIGFKHFQRLFDSYFFWNIMGNTLIISGLKIIITFPAPIILALLLNEVRLDGYKRTVQTISYLPHFMSMVVVAGLVRVVLTAQGGLLNQVIEAFGGAPHNFLTDPKSFRWVLVGTTLWQTVGWGSIIYLAAIANLNPEIYEAAVVDGANKWHQIWFITLPGIRHVIVLLFIFRIGGLLDAGFGQILLLYSESVYEVADIIDTYVYRAGLLSLQYSYATAVGLFKSIVALVLVLSANWLAHRLGERGIW